DKPITIELYNEDTSEWSHYAKAYASINKDTKGRSEGDTEDLTERLVFSVRYFQKLFEVRKNLKAYRIVYAGIPFAVDGYDDYMEMHRVVKITGAAHEWN
ncbi:MAG: hypothetical protein RR672_12040, partial [Raoultibacter sp.]